MLNSMAVRRYSSRFFANISSSAKRELPLNFNNVRLGKKEVEVVRRFRPEYEYREERE